MRLIIGLLLVFGITTLANAENAEEGGIKAKLGEKLQEMQGAFVDACADKQECLDRVFMLMGVIWENRDRRDVHKQLAFCTATVAYKKGYVLNPKKMWTEMNADLAKTTAVEVCECVSDKWKNPSDVCHTFSQKLKPDMDLLEVSDDGESEQPTP